MFKYGDRCLLVLGEALVTLGLVLHGQRVRQGESDEATDT